MSDFLIELKPENDTRTPPMAEPYVVAYWSVRSKAWKLASKMFATTAEAQAWIERHEPFGMMHCRIYKLTME